MGVDVHKVAYWRLPRAFTCAWASEELFSTLTSDKRQATGRAARRQDKQTSERAKDKGWVGDGDENVSTRREDEWNAAYLRIAKSDPEMGAPLGIVGSALAAAARDGAEAVD